MVYSDFLLPGKNSPLEGGGRGGAKYLLIIKGFSGPIGPRVGENMQFLGFLLGQSTYFIGYMLPTFGILCNLGGFCGPFGPRVGKFAFFDVILLKA